MGAACACACCLYRADTNGIGAPFPDCPCTTCDYINSETQFGPNCQDCVCIEAWVSFREACYGTGPTYFPEGNPDLLQGLLSLPEPHNCSCIGCTTNNCGCHSCDEYNSLSVSLMLNGFWGGCCESCASAEYDCGFGLFGWAAVYGIPIYSR